MQEQTPIRNNFAQLKKQIQKICTSIIEARKMSGQTQKEVAEWVGVSLRTYLEFEKGNCTIELLCKVADKFDIEIIINFKS
jgi:DNA-binding XRE family transcriptional regulator